MKFDIIVANPPYKRGLHLEFLERSLELLNKNSEIIFVHPAEWLVQKRFTSVSEYYYQIKDKLNKQTVSIEFINNPWRNNGADLYVPLCITHIKNNNVKKLTFEDNRTIGYDDKMKLIPKDKENLLSLNEIVIYGDHKLSMSFLNKILKFPNKFKGKEKIKNGNFYVNLSSLNGNGKTTIVCDGEIEFRTIPNMYSLINSTSLEVTSKPQRAKPQSGKEIGNEKIWFSFKTLNEAQNCLDFINKSKIFRAFLVLIKIDQHAADSLLGILPWLNWHESWTDEKLSDLFQLNENEMKNIIDILNIISI